jgi:PKHD-type hydroxylase
MTIKNLCHFGTIPEDLMNILTRDLTETFDYQLQTSKLYGGGEDFSKRRSRNAWVPTTHWTAGLIWSYIDRANNEIFKYDLDCIDGEAMQYTHYGLNEYYGWHQDEGLSTMYKPAAAGKRDGSQAQDYINENCEKVRKLTCILQLSHEEDYEGGNVQLRDHTGECYFVPKQRGTIFLFDSRLQHRAMKVTKGLRKSLISWTIGNRWK